MLDNKEQQHDFIFQLQRALQQSWGIFYKNMCNHLSNKKKFLGEFILPIMICIIYATKEKNQRELNKNFNNAAQNMILIVVMDLLLKIYIGLIGSTAIKELVSLFIPQRSQKFRQYQFIFGLSHQIYTLSNLFYMGFYLSLLILPFFLTICYFNFDLIYILYFGSFVISQLTMTLALTAFFKDYKIANEIIGMFFSLTAFLVFFYENDPKKTLNFVDFVTMIMPNSSFTIAILYKNTQASLISLFCAKIYLLIYSMVEYPQFFKEKLCRCCQKITNYLPLFQRQQTNLMEQFELNQIINPDLENPQKKIVIKIEGLVKSYSIKKNLFNALNGVNIKIHKSQIFGLLGRNGAGKTTLVDILTKITKPSAGTFQIVNNKETIGICYQHEILYENLTVQQHLYMYSLIKPIKFQSLEQRNNHIQEIITMLNISGERKKQVKQLSGGNKRKLTIAIAIIGSPQILIFDEPTSGLDPLSRIHVWEILEKLRNTESTIILTTHHLDEAEKLSDWICVIEKGAVIVENTAENIKQKYGKGYHLGVSLIEEDSKFSFEQIQNLKGLIEKNKLKSNELEHSRGQLNFLVKPPNKNMSSLQFEDYFINLIEQLERDTKITFKFHSNTLEQSFIAILKDSDNNSGDSLNQHSLTRRQIHSLSQYNKFTKAMFQLYGIFLKNVYYQKSQFTQFILLNNINILVLLISIYFNKFMFQVIKKNQPDSGDKLGDPNANNSAYALLQGYVILAVAYIYTPVYQKQKKIRAILNTRGVSWVTYWLGNFAFDFLVFNLNLLVLAQFIAPQIVNQIGWFSLFKVGVGMILFAYCFSFVFKKAKTASGWFTLINVVAGMAAMGNILAGKQTFMKYFSFLKYFYPFYDLTTVILLQNKTLGEQNIAKLIDIEKPDGSYIYYNILIELFIIFCLETEILLRLKHLCSRQQINEEASEVIKLQNISKKYGDIQALKNVNYFVNEQRIALLGHNGAGKSTTFELLSSQLNQDQGQLYIEKKLKMPYQKILKSTGICYQDDSLWEGILVSQIFKIISFIVPVQQSQNEIDWLCQNIQYEVANQDKRFDALSGGNKRKMCMMIALYGDPLVRLLDQCSTGLDPSSRVAMVETIKYSRTGTTVFTTHSMSEAQNLCLKTVIMSKGQVLQFDNINKLKKKYFDCCWIDIKIAQAQQQQNLAWKVIKQLEIKGVKSVSRQRGSIRFQIAKKEVRLSHLMRSIQRLKSKRIVQSFSNVEPKLEDVYIKVTKDEQTEHVQQRVESAGANNQLLNQSN